MEIKSVFGNGDKIPSKYTCDGENISPPLMIEDVPENAKSLALIMYDPDIPQVFKEQKGIEGWDHWVVWNIPIDIKEIPSDKKIGIEGKNTSGKNSYGGPCPPKEYQPSKHKYFFWLYALDVENLDLSEESGKKELEEAMKDHIIDKAELMGVYEKKD